MLLKDFSYIIIWWLYLFIIGIIFFPFVRKIFNNLFDKGYIFSKISGIALISYIIFILGSIKLLPFERINVFLILVLVFVSSVIYHRTKILNLNFSNIKILVFEEVLFFSFLLLWSYVKGFQPDIHGLEKFMDFGFMNSILRTEYFPPVDMWYPPEPINYYYFGHLTTAVLMKLTNISPFISYNLMLSTIFAFTAMSAFSIVSTITFLIFKKPKTAILTGLMSGILLVFAGNLHTIYSFFAAYTPPENPVPFWNLKFLPLTFPNNYWYPNATRFIPFTIHEFPSYSFVVSDLHGHVLDIPFVMLTLGLMLVIFLNKKVDLTMTCLVSFMLAVMYMTNAWDGIIYLGLFSLSVLIINLSILKHKKIKERKKNNSYSLNLLTKIPKASINFFYFLTKGYSNKKEFLAQSAKFILIACLGYFIFALPFNLNFSPFVSGIGILCAPEFLTKIGKFGPLLFESDHCQRTPFWMFVILYSFFYILATTFVLKLSKIKELTKPLIFLVILIFFATLLIIIPEFIYAKDIYPQHYRANTVFKFTYQAYIMLTLVSSIAITYILKTGKKIIWIPIILALLSLNLSYSYFSIKSYFADLKYYKGLDGISYVKDVYPGVYESIHWIQKNIKGSPVILESQGDSYTDYGIVSSNTGLPTVLGWTVHEWLWRGDYSFPQKRLDDVRALYEDEIYKTEELIKRYNVEYVFIGPQEKSKYKYLNENKFELLGDVIYQNETVKIYKINTKD